ncbi:MAG: 50S ribosomal protein L23 [Nanoarchaeota archaeon]|nr:50S ribosomal protein L23 [Nanoarchaeota archaeon]
MSTLKPITTEKAVKLIEIENVLMFEVDRRLNKLEIKTQVEEAFNVKVETVRTMIRLNAKIAYVKLKKQNPAIDVATKLGMM